MMHRAETATLNRRAAVATLTGNRGDAIFLSSLGSPTYDLAACGDHERNLYLWGGMGGTVAMGLGLALAQPDVPVCILVGDGEMLMGMGSFATVAQQGPANLTLVILDNGLYGETGEQRSHTATGTDLAGVAQACGIAEVRRIADAEGVEQLASELRQGKGPIVARIAIDPAKEKTILPSRDGAALARRLQQALGAPAI